MLQPLHGERQVRTAFVSGHGVNLIDDHRVNRAQRLAALGSGNQQVERLRGGDHEGAGASDHRLPLALRRIAGAHAEGDGRHRQPQFDGDLGDLDQGSLQVLCDIDRQGLQR